MQAQAHRLTLQVLRLDGQLVTATLQKVFEERGGTIGRAAQNDWVLPDPQRFLSAHHATVFFEEGSFRLVDCSTNGIYVNDEAEPLGPGRIAALSQGDKLQFGDYEIGVAIAAPMASRTPATAATAAPSLAKALDPLQLLDAHAKAPARAAAAAASEPSHREPWFDAGRTPDAVVSVGGSAIVDPLALLGQSVDLPLSQALHAHAVPTLGPATARDDAPMLASSFHPPAAAAPVPEDWFKTGITIAPTTPAAVPTPAASPVIAARAVPSPAVAVSAKSAAQTTARPAPVPAADAPDTNTLQAALDLLLHAAGLDPARTPRDADPRQTLQTLGTVLHDAIAALRELMLQRSTTRQRLGLAATCITPRDNNPLKFSARGVTEVIDSFLFDHGPACLDAKTAIREALQDLKTQRDEERLSLLQGLRAHLDRIDPQLIERSCNEPRRLRLTSGKSDCWALYITRHAELRQHLDGHAETSPPTPLPRRRAAPIAIPATPRAEFSHGLE